MQLVRKELLGTRVFVLTRNGRILNLAKGATLADAAAQLTDGDLDTGALRGHLPLVNGVPMLAGYELSNGDLVSFELPTAERTLLAATTGAPLGLLGGGGGGGMPSGGDGDVYDGEFVTPIALASAADAAAATAAATVDAANAAIGDAQHVNMGWQPCRACRPLRGDMLVGTRPVAGEGGVPTAATSEARIYRTYSMPRCACVSCVSELCHPLSYMHMHMHMHMHIQMQMHMHMHMPHVCPSYRPSCRPPPRRSAHGLRSRQSPRGAAGYSSCGARRSAAECSRPAGSRRTTGG